jgi:hypothetical protein
MAATCSPSVFSGGVPLITRSCPARRVLPQCHLVRLKAEPDVYGVQFRPRECLARRCGMAWL